MKNFPIILKLFIASGLTLAGLAGCKSTDGGGSGATASGDIYSGIGFYDPWYYGPGDYPPDVIVTPPDRPTTPPPDQTTPPPRPTHPIVTPPSPTPRPMPMPSIPTTPRPSFRR